jgi:hypothetical protein
LPAEKARLWRGNSNFQTEGYTLCNFYGEILWRN